MDGRKTLIVCKSSIPPTHTHTHTHTHTQRKAVNFINIIILYGAAMCQSFIDTVVFNSHAHDESQNLISEETEALR